MRVLHLTPQMGAGGAERQLTSLIKYLQRYPELEQHLAIIYPETVYPFFFRYEISIPYSFLNKPVGKGGRIPLVWRYWQLIRHFKPDIVHAHQWYAMDLARTFHRKLGKQQTYPKILARTPNPIVEDGRVDSERSYAGMADKIIVVSGPSFEQYRTLIPASANNLILISNGVDTEVYRPGNRKEARRKLGIPEHLILAIHPARICYQKNQLGIAQAVQKLVEASQWPENARIFYLGNVQETDYAQALHQFVRQNSLNNYGQFYPATPDLLDYYHACDIVLLPSFFEGASSVLLEAAACARPSLVTDMANTLSVVSDEQTGWVVHPQNIAAGLYRALTALPGERDMMGQKAYQHVREQYSMEQIAQQYYELYREMLSQ